jgi:hypothetical protein
VNVTQGFMPSSGPPVQRPATRQPWADGATARSSGDQRRTSRACERISGRATVAAEDARGPDPTELVRHSVVARYRTAKGAEHVVAVQPAWQGAWQVLDLHDDSNTVVQVLGGRDDGLAQAQALALDYASEKQAYHDGTRSDDPFRRRRPRVREQRARTA